MFKPLLLFVLFYMVAVSGQGTAPNLGGTTAVYGTNETDFHYWCHDPTAGVYQYAFIGGWGHGNITEQNGSFVGEGIWVTCGTVGRERITISGNTWTSTWWYIQEGDTTNPLFLSNGKLPSQSNPITLQKFGGSNETGGAQSNETETATAQSCWWLNQGIDTKTTNLGGSFQGSYFTSFCLIGDAYVRGVYNGTDVGSTEVFAGYYSAVGVDFTGSTGHFVEVFARDCYQGCDLFKLIGDGNTLVEKFWCRIDFTENLLGFGIDISRRVSPAVTSINETNSCYFAAQPAFGYLATPLSNATFP